jgi:cardiolipin synthase
MGFWMTEALDWNLAWWVWTLIVVGLISVSAVIAALFLPDWHRLSNLETTSEAPTGSEQFITALAEVLNVPVLRGGHATILQNGDAFFPAILAAIRSARQSVNFQVYTFDPNGIGQQFLDAFTERARAGVEVRILVDAFGSYRFDRRSREALERAGCKVVRFRPLRLTTLVRVFKRDHRRAIVIDGRIAFTGGAAVADHWTGDAQDPHHWRDSMTRVTGALTRGIQTAFGANWVYCTGEILSGARFYPSDPTGTVATGAARGPVPPSADGTGQRVDGSLPAAVAVVSSPSDAAQPIRLLYWLSFKNARRRILISSSYFVPAREIRAVVAERARAGIDVRILVPGENTDAKPVRLAGRAFYGELLEAGVRIFEYRPTMMHAKTVVVDGIWSIVGSSNMDERSTELNEENNLAIADPEFAADVESGLLRDIEQAREIDREEWRRRSRLQRFQERVAKLLLEQY